MFALDNAERARREASAAATLAAAEERFRALAEQSIAGVYMVDEGVLRYINPRGAQVLGYAVDEMTGRPVRDFVAFNAWPAIARSALRRLAGRGKDGRHDFQAVRKDGSPVTVGVHDTTALVGGRRILIGVLQDITDKVRAEAQVQHYVEQIEQAVQSTIDVVARISELRDPYTHGHERRVGEMAAAIAQEMGLSHSEVEGMRVAGYLHDVGKISIPAEILAKPGKLTKVEFELIKEHAQLSYEILRDVPFPWPVAEAAWQHHERLDGSGYPRGLKGEQISVHARILAVADTVESMASHRPYRPSLGIEAALRSSATGTGAIARKQ